MKRILIFFGAAPPSTPSPCSRPRRCSPIWIRALCAPDGGHHPGGQMALLHRGLEAIAADRWQQRGKLHPLRPEPDRGAKELLLLDGSGTRQKFDGAFPVLHGKNGEDGTPPGAAGAGGGAGDRLRQSVQRPVHGQGPLPQAGGPGGSKGARQRRLPPGRPQEELAEAARKLGYPLFVKPVRPAPPSASPG